MIELSPYINRAMADVLVSAYKEERLTQQQLSDRTGINMTTMQRLMAGKSEVGVEDLLKLASAIGVTPEELMTRAITRAEKLLSAVPVNINSKRPKTAAEFDEYEGDQAANEFDPQATEPDED